jgi:hypothetical protein
VSEPWVEFTLAERQCQDLTPNMLVIEQRSSEIWVLLGEVKTEFGKFGDVIDTTQKKLKTV